MSANSSDTFVDKPVMSAADLRTLKLKAWQLNSGVSPIARGLEKERDVLSWIYRWGWASATTIDKLAGSPNNGYARKLERRKLIQGMRTEFGGGKKGIPTYIFTLTEFGREEAENHVNELLDYESNFFKINQSNLRHDEYTQRITFDNYYDNSISEFLTPKELADKDQEGMKKFDVLWVTFENEKIGIEVEFSGKWGRKIDQFINSIFTALVQKTVHRVIIFAGSKAIYERYKTAFSEGSSYNLWIKDSQSRWKADTRARKISKDFAARVECRLLSD